MTPSSESGQVGCLSLNIVETSKNNLSITVRKRNSFSFYLCCQNTFGIGIYFAMKAYYQYDYEFYCFSVQLQSKRNKEIVLEGFDPGGSGGRRWCGNNRS